MKGEGIMDIAMLERFFMLCTIFNVAVLSVMFILFVFAGDAMYQLHRHWFPMSQERFKEILYMFFGFYKIIVYVFNLVPWIALTLMT